MDQEYVDNKIQMIKLFILVLAISVIPHSLQLAFELKKKPNMKGSLDLAALRQAELDKHNQYRAKHGVPPLVINDTINKAAQNHADNLKKTKHFAYSFTKIYGENIYYLVSTSAQTTYSKAEASVSWYSQNRNYDYKIGLKHPDITPKPFTAMIWKGVKSVGFGYARTTAIQHDKTVEVFYIVANYYPPPNINGQYVANVPPPIY